MHVFEADNRLVSAGKAKGVDVLRMNWKGKDLTVYTFIELLNIVI